MTMTMSRRILSFLLHCWIVAATGVITADHQQQLQQHEKLSQAVDDSSPINTSDNDTTQPSEPAFLRILRAALSAPNVNINSLMEDIKSVFGEETKLLDPQTLQELIADHPNRLNDETLRSTCQTTEPSFVETNETVAQQQRIVSAQTELPIYADRHIKDALAAAEDYDCMEREFDFSDPTVNLTDAALVLAKCRILVVRNVFAQDLILQSKANISNYLFDLHQAKVPLGPTTVGNPFFYARRDKHRFDVILPKHLRNDDIIMNPKIAQLMQHPKILGDNMVVNTFATVVAAPGATNGHNHMDELYTNLFDTDNDSFLTHSLSGNDIPPWAITMFTPLLNITKSHGPTEFCIGTNHLMGLSMDVPTHDKTLLMKDAEKHAGSILEFAFDDDNGIDRDCPPPFSRIPLLNMGDAVFFYYTISHRGTANNSTDFRAIEYVLYSRPWYRDSNFDIIPQTEDDDTLSDADWAMRYTRFAVVDPNLITTCPEPPCPERIPLETMLDFMHDVDPQQDGRFKDNQ